VATWSSEKAYSEFQSRSNTACNVCRSAVLFEFKLAPAALAFPIDYEFHTPDDVRALYESGDTNLGVEELFKFQTELLKHQNEAPNHKDYLEPRTSLINQVDENGNPSMYFTLHEFVRTPPFKFPVVVIEWGKISDPSLEKVISGQNMEDTIVYGAELSEIRLEHTAKKTVDPRWLGASKTGFTPLARQIAGEEDTRQWKDLAWKARNKKATIMEADAEKTPMARYVFSKQGICAELDTPEIITEGGRYAHVYGKVGVAPNLSQ